MKAQLLEYKKYSRILHGKTKNSRPRSNRFIFVAWTNRIENTISANIYAGLWHEFWLERATGLAEMDIVVQEI